MIKRISEKEKNLDDKINKINESQSELNSSIAIHRKKIEEVNAMLKISK